MKQSLLLSFGLYFGILLLLAFLAYRATQNVTDYLLGGRHLGRFVTALATGASDMSGWLLMGLPGAIYIGGLSQLWMPIGLVVGAWLNWRLVAHRLRLYTEKLGNTLTLSDYLAKRFHENHVALRLVTGLVILIFFVCYCAAGWVAGARLFETLFDMQYLTALGVFATVTMLYVYLGGFLAVSWADALQGMLMLGALLITPVLVVLALGGWERSLEVLAQYYPAHLGLFSHSDKLTIISLLAWGLGYFGQPHILLRFMAAKSLHILPAARQINLLWMILCLTGAVAVGLWGSAYCVSSQAIFSLTIKENPENIFIGLSQQLFPTYLGGIILSAVLSAIMSSLSSQLLVCASTLTQDIYQAFLYPRASQKMLIQFSRGAVLLVTFLSVFLAANSENRILTMVSYAWAGFGAALGPVILFSLFWSRMTANGALAGMTGGALTVLLWKQYIGLKLYEILPGFIVASLLIVSISLLDSRSASTALRRFRMLTD
jgi:sodium/proline symporter